MNLKRGAAGYGVGKGNISLTLKLLDMFVGQNGVDYLLDVQWTKRLIGKETTLGTAATGACPGGLTGAKMQLAAAGFNHFVEQFVNMNFAEW